MFAVYADYRKPIEAGGAMLKLYHLTAADSPVPDDLEKLGAARSHWLEDVFEGAV